MTKEECHTYIKENMSEEDKNLGIFSGQRPMKLWLFFLIGPFAALSIKQYFVGVSEKGLYFHALNLMGKFEAMDFFDYSEIDTLSIKSGFVTSRLDFKFTNGTKLTLRAPIKGVQKVSKFTPELESYIQEQLVNTSA